MTVGHVLKVSLLYIIRDIHISTIDMGWVPEETSSYAARNETF